MWNNDNTPRQYTAQERLMICRQCPFVRQTPGVGLTCGTLLRPDYDKFGRKLTCGCILQAKTRLAGKQCPQNKW